MEKNKVSLFASGVSDRSYYLRLDDGRLVFFDFGCVNLQSGLSYTELLNSYIAELRSVSGGDTVKIAALFITHPHDDHLNFLEYLVKTGQDKYFIIEKVIRKFPPKDWVPKNDWEKPDYPQNMEILLQNLKGTEIITAKRGMTFDFGGVNFEILLTADEAPDDAKDMNYFSMLIKQSVGNKTLLWTGDMSDSLGKKAMEICGEKLACDILQIPHHGTPNCGTLEFFEICNAKKHLWIIGKKTFLDPEYQFCYGKFPIPTAIYDMPIEKVFCGEKLVEIKF